MESNVSDHQSKEGLSLSCHPGRGLESITLCWSKTKSGVNRGVSNHPRPVLAPGSALGLLLSIALSSGQANQSVVKTSSSLQSTTWTDLRKEDISNELRTRTFLLSCNRSFWQELRTRTFLMSCNRSFWQEEAVHKMPDCVCDRHS